MMDNPSRGELEGTVSTTLTNTTKKSIKMSENISTTSGKHDIISMGVVSLGMRRKYAGVKITSKNSVIRM